MNKKWNDVYKRNRELDAIFINRYQENEPKLYEKNCIEFLVELGEFVNETKCFKYWTVKVPNKEKVLEELADCFTILLTFYNYYHLDLKDEKSSKESDLLMVINDTYLLGTKLLKNCNEELIRKIFSHLLTISSLLNLKESEVIDACFHKLEIVEERLNSNY